METIIVGSTVSMNFYLDGERVLTVREADGRGDAELTEYGLALDPARAAEFGDEVVSHARAILESPEGCSGPLRSKADENAKCGLLGLGAGALGATAGFLLGGPPGATVGGLAASSLGVLCGWLVAKVCEENSEGC
ncbi:hypothetical protein [Nannocystis pusilla]|uniref:Glycine zipper family protein n=1 Tax=Nannocystis pusilla TaxID=889268 RepID=A0ABS7U342_9BACT|nr:hypothetical protein [Nannocystis pusilla]MBZ5714861.1 hypothetical protein [Nannocystis pusilla]